MLLLWKMQRFEDFAKVKITELELKKCNLGDHQFSPWVSCAEGLVRECKVCRKIENGKIFRGKVLINPPLDERGFLDKDKLNGS